MSPTQPTEDDQKRELVDSLRSVRDDARDSRQTQPSMPEPADATRTTAALSKIAVEDTSENVSSPARDDLNSLWNVASATPRSFLGKLFKPFRQLLQRFALGRVVERQVHMNSAQVRFDNEVIEYMDARLDRMGRHYDHVLGLHGKRMEEIDERHLILQQELIRHVHDLVERIEFVFETAETNHLQIDGALRETREELKELAKRLETLGAPSHKES